MSTPEGGFSGESGHAELGGVRATPGHDGGPAAGRKGNGVLHRVAATERERQTRGKAVARAVGIDDGARQGRRPKGTPGLDPAAEAAGRRDDEVRRRVELAGAVELRIVLPAPDEGVELTQMGPGRIRAVTHLDVDRAGIERALEVLRKLLG